MQVKVLLADDNPDARETLGMLLHSHGHDVRCAADGREAVAIAGQFQPKACVLDFNMPFMTGAEAAAVIRMIVKGGSTTICVTGTRLGKIDSKAFDYCFAKPCDIEVILNALTEGAS